MRPTETRTYAVRWWQQDGPPRTGRLELRHDTACFSARGAEPLVLGLDAVVEVTIVRSATPPEGRVKPVLVVRSRDGGPVFVRTILGFGVLHEIADALAPSGAARPAA